MKKTKHVLELEEKLLLGIVAVATMMVGVAFLVCLIPTPSDRADTELEKMADDYYLTYLYPHLMSASRDLDRAFRKYKTSGVPTVYLRQLLHYNNDQFASLEPTFKAVGCDTNRTGVRYYPKEPYGPTDYEVKYYWGCSKKAE